MTEDQMTLRSLTDLLSSKGSYWHQPLDKLITQWADTQYGNDSTKNVLARDLMRNQLTSHRDVIQSALDERAEAVELQKIHLENLVGRLKHEQPNPGNVFSEIEIIQYRLNEPLDEFMSLNAMLDVDIKSAWQEVQLFEKLFADIKGYFAARDQMSFGRLAIDYKEIGGLLLAILRVQLELQKMEEQSLVIQSDIRDKVMTLHFGVDTILAMEKSKKEHPKGLRHLGKAWRRVRMVYKARRENISNKLRRRIGKRECFRD